MRTSILEDDPRQIELMRTLLRDTGHVLQFFMTAIDLKQALREESFDLILLGAGPPAANGNEMLAWIRENLRDGTPVIFISDNGREDVVASALKAGADDYLVKPLRRLEMLARMEAVFRRAHRDMPAGEVFQRNEFRVDVAARQILRDGEPVLLTQKCFELAVFLLRNVGRQFSRGHLLESVWGRRPDLSTRTIDTHISRVRTQLRLVPDNGWRLVAIHQQGYRLERARHPLPGDASKYLGHTPKA